MKSGPEGYSVEWELLLPGSTVRFSDEAISQLSSQRREFGLLAGRIDSPSPLRVVVETTIAASRLNTEHPPLVGCYRRHADGLPGLMPIDREFVANCIPSGEGVYLVLFPAGGRSVPAEFYVVKDGVIDPVLQRGVATFVRDDAPMVKTSVSSPIEVGAHRSRFRVSPWMALSAGLAILIVLGFADRTRSDESPALDGGEPMAMAAIAPLQLRVIPLDSLLQVRWSPDGETRTDFARGVLSIQDGQTQKRVALDSDQLKNASFTYLPSSRKVQFQLELTRSDFTTQVASAGFEASPPALPATLATPAVIPARASEPLPRPLPPRLASISVQAQKPVRREPHVVSPIPAQRHEEASEAAQPPEKPVARVIPPAQTKAQDAPPRVRYERSVEEREPAPQPAAPRKGFRAKLSRMWPFRHAERDGQ